MALGCVILIILLLLGIRYQKYLHEWIAKSPLSFKWKARFQSATEKFIQGVSGMHEIAFVIGALGLSLVIWIIEGTTLYLFVRAFPIIFSYPQAFFCYFSWGYR